ncbi:MAG: head GIN domain-containing protein [Sediminibacterium sp.]|nr:head GIN domain-containing protein [uncultured Sediminibacterium sp.]
MRTLLVILAIMVTAASCIFLDGERVTGNGNITVEDRVGLNAHRIKLAGFMDVELRQGTGTEVKVEADDNLQEYIITEMDEGVLVIKTRNNVRMINSERIKIYITTDRLELLTLSGSGNIIGMDKFTGSDRLKLRVSGVGDLKLDLNTPELEAEISGSGSLALSGETRDAKITINGVGNCNADNLKAENATVKISGSGDVKIFADSKLDITIRGVGSVYYKGEASVSQKISGSGEVKRLEE